MMETVLQNQETQNSPLSFPQRNWPQVPTESQTCTSRDYESFGKLCWLHLTGMGYWYYFSFYRRKSRRESESRHDFSFADGRRGSITIFGDYCGLLRWMIRWRYHDVGKLGSGQRWASLFYEQLKKIASFSNATSTSIRHRPSSIASEKTV